jgi:hypothetical protein
MLRGCLPIDFAPRLRAVCAIEGAPRLRGAVCVAIEGAPRLRAVVMHIAINRLRAPGNGYLLHCDLLIPIPVVIKRRRHGARCARNPVKGSLRALNFCRLFGPAETIRKLRHHWEHHGVLGEELRFDGISRLHASDGR